MQLHDQTGYSHLVDEEEILSPPLMETTGDDQYVVDVTLKHVLLFLGGLALAGCVVAVTWEWANHRFRAKRYADIATAASIGATALAAVFKEARLMMAHIEVVDDNE